MAGSFITQEERKKIQEYLDSTHFPNIKQFSKEINRTPSAILREIKNYSTKGKYNADIAHDSFTKKISDSRSKSYLNRNADANDSSLLNRIEILEMQVKMLAEKLRGKND